MRITSAVTMMPVSRSFAARVGRVTATTGVAGSMAHDRQAMERSPADGPQLVVSRGRGRHSRCRRVGEPESERGAAADAATALDSEIAAHEQRELATHGQAEPRA